MSTPTPGSWIIATGNSWRRIVSEQTGMTVCEPITQPDGHPDLHFPNGGADGPDAHILAASRDMYEALKELRAASEGSFAGWHDKYRGAVVAMLAALAKAEGKS